MKCPFCKNEETRVIDKRDIEGLVRRRRECLKCKKRFTTYERVEMELRVIKKDGRREAFDIIKLKRGIEKALEKRPIKTEEVERLIEDIKSKVYKQANGKEIESKKVGEIVMEKLKKTDKVAYIRFASVYREFKDIDDFKEELKKITKNEV
ncbi:MAG: transcriptional regulator NrdR [Candidatus Pacearchaeota archaeon]